MDSDNTVNSDFERSRGVYLDLISKGQDALENMTDLAVALEHPRAYEVVATLIKNISDVNDKVMDLHKTRKEIERKDPDQPKLEGPVNNNLFVGTTSDLQKMLDDRRKTVDVTPNDSNGT